MNQEIEVDDDDLLQSDDISEGDYVKHQKYKQMKTESHNTLEHETFSMGQ